MSFLNNPDFISLLCGAAAFSVVVLIWYALVEKDPLTARLKYVAEERERLRQDMLRPEKKSRRSSAEQISMMKRIIESLKMVRGNTLQELRGKLMRGGFRSRDAWIIFLFIKLCMVGGFLFGSFFLIFVVKAIKMKAALGLLSVVFAGILGWVLPNIFLKNMTQKREDLFRKNLPDALDLMVICAEAGLSLDSAFERVAREIGPSCAELAEEFGLTAAELGFLPDRATALQNFAERVPLPGALALVNTLIQTEKYGTPLAQALRVLSAELREERMMKAEEKAAKLPATLTVPMIVFILPPLFVVLMGPAILKVMGTVH
jgi:tight adherence protein C